MSFYTSEDRITVDLKLHVNYSEEKFKNNNKKRVVQLYFLTVKNCGKKKKDSVLIKRDRT